MSEERLQQECYLWFRGEYKEFKLLLFHVPNGGARNAREGAKFKTMGVTAGVADLFFLLDSVAYFFELKREAGGQSPKQKKWQEAVEKQGFQYFIIRDLKTFQEIIKKIFDMYYFLEE